jgi:hypothetical protein
MSDRICFKVNICLMMSFLLCALPVLSSIFLPLHGHPAAPLKAALGADCLRPSVKTNHL